MASLTDPRRTEVCRPHRRRFSQVLRVFGDRHFHTDGELLALAFGAGGTLWSMEEPGVLRQWDAAAGQQLGWTFLSDRATIWRFSGDARLVASAADAVAIWDVASAQLLAVVPQPSWVTALAFAPGGGLVATGHDEGLIRLWDPASHQLVRILTGHEGAISALAWRADGMLASASEERTVRLWDSAGRKAGELVGHTDRISALAWDPHSDRLASAGWDTAVRLWDTRTGEPIILLNAHADQVTALAFHPDGSRLACADSAHAVYLWDTQHHQLVQRWQEHRADVVGLAFSADGGRLASGGTDRLLHLWDTAAGQRLSSRGEAVLDHVSLALTPDGSHLISTAGGTGLHVWETATGRTMLEQRPPEAWHVLAGSPDGRWLAAGGVDTAIRLHDAATAELHSTWMGQDGPAAALAFAPDSARLASASSTDGMVWLWRVPTGEPCLVIPEAADTCMIEALAFHPDGHFLAVGGIDWLATGGSDGAVCLWDVDKPGPVVTLDGGTTSLAFHPCGRWLAGASLGDHVLLWDMHTLERVARLTGHTASVTCVAFSPDGRWLASGSDDHTVRLWHAVSWEPAAALELPTQIKALAFSPNSRLLYTGNGNTTSYQLDVARLARCKPARTMEPEWTPLPLALPGALKLQG